MKSKLIPLVIGLFGIFMVSSSFAAEHEEAGGDAGMQAEQQQGDMYNQNLKKFSSMKGTKIYDANGENVGQINDVVVDAQTGRVTYALLQSGGVFGIGDQQFLIPWQALEARGDQPGYQLQLTSQEMENAPKGDQIASRDQDRQIHEFYGVSPYWEDQGQQFQDQQQDQMAPETDQMSPETDQMSPETDQM